LNGDHISGVPRGVAPEDTPFGRIPPAAYSLGAAPTTFTRRFAAALEGADIPLYEAGGTLWA
jgi:hypothetical protein